ncbi:MAG: radical SAM protein, partial [Spirochaeta sp.]|nr:radical SAM protein [Spirochaeta sp.]
LVIAGGPGISNPVPFGAFIDAVFIGEAEGLFPQLASEIAERRKAGQGRAKLLEVLQENPHVWYSGKSVPTRRAIWNGFSKDRVRVRFPVAGVKAVQDHGTIEIMRGCPHGCRFCHAGVFYKPYRMKPVAAIIEEAEFLVDTYGYRDITLSSLSSGDYSEIGRLVNELNAHFAGRGVSFALPSLRVSSFTLPIIGGLATVKKSGLTFAVETPTEWGQLVLNKQVSRQNCVEILREAKRLGWRVAKFYFMIGLPVETQEGHESLDVGETALHEARAIVDFVSSVQAEVGININLTVNTFVPKPHTPFQWAPQLPEDRALECLYEIRRGLKGRSIKVSWNSPFLSLLEGVITRGDERSGELVIEAFRRGARMDAWDDQAARELWRGVFADASWDVVGETLSGRDLDSALPWDTIESGVSKEYLRKEYRRSRAGELTERCAPQCRDHCGICNRGTRVVDLLSATPTTPEIIEDLPVQDIDMHDPGQSFCRISRLCAHLREELSGPGYRCE